MEHEGFLKKDVMELDHDSESTLEKNMVWLLASARSGSTWLALNLLSHNTKLVNEPHIAEHLAMRTPAFQDKFIRRIDEMKKLPSYFFSDKYKKTWQFYLRKMILNRIYAEINNLSKKVIIKEVGGLGASDIIAECLPNCKMIILIRDGRDNIDSLIAARQKDGFMRKTGSFEVTDDNRLKFLENQAKIWVGLMENLLDTYKTKSKGSVFLIKYEDLRVNTLENLKKIYEFIGIDIDNSVIEKLISESDFDKIPKKLRGPGKFARSASPGKWKEHFNDEEKDLLEKIMGETLRKLRYK